MRCWKTPRGRYLVESPDVRRMIPQDPLLSAEERVLLRKAKAWFTDNAPGERFSGFARYYEVDQQGAVIIPHEEYSYSDEDDLYSCSYRILGDQLMEFWLTTPDEGESVLKVKARIRDLQTIELPEGMTIT